ncbi:sugar ABC transporter ATP-binding protein [Aneurinibacillus aneurinilyticus]|jgi:ribose transport system ATP-binding protein|uniref:Ribose transport ATP-binding protein rbsa n=1 Tax=Aneurinibacillus aneurinilyticus ATCC 12856 TaxID=649747 RepID=U1WEZ3_ANEAE|nr:sugar ABC transporter ATP-binding protein [Aneurinibacillus aneurinilyticus]ERI07129.1 ribose transport ATP-binding protein rbsa [Aneurinibacillus aneurinilyticus ATCC 12856]MCI1693474.1 sugar ABC transporter ATP-binding protein [Aneurinibacillus aneurinilyticus]MED0704528.1 sugar ABC transporter ATP-binding protein [Aneurinibacillus aneurinilyticus]MED0725164.1 sugar ABC transporter ATP-binding protein [Aneurinibacillus aneurinilyticus]MED0733940.1 sugar ABC transporter ATP-binding protein
MNTLIEMTGIDKSFGKVNVLKNVSFSLEKGEIHALMGENGAGKSTLMKILTGIYTKDAGNIRVRGQEVEIGSPKEAEQLGIAVIHQELNIIPQLTVMENMFLGRDLCYGKTGILRTREMKQRTREYLNRLGVHLDPGMEAGKLSIGQQQMIEIARALSVNAEVLIMDEPTAALTDREIEALFNVMRELRSQGVGIVYVSHRMEEIFAMCDRISVLRDGTFVGTETIKETDLDTVVRMMVGRQLGERFPERNTAIGEERLRVEELSDGEIISNISFFARRGEVLGIAGLMGSGRTEIARTLFGVSEKQTGKVFLDGKEVRIRKPDDAIAHGIAFVTEDRKAQGLVLGLSVRENIALTNLNALSQNGVMSGAKEEQLVRDMIQRLNIKASSGEQTVKSLSGGNQQKVVIGKWLGIMPKVLILDEPTRGVDIGAKKEIYNIMNQLTAEGVTIIMISSELPEILGMSDRILVMHEGRLAAIMDKTQATQEKIMHAATGGK